MTIAPEPGLPIALGGPAAREERARPGEHTGLDEPGRTAALSDYAALDRPAGFGNPSPEQLLFYWMPVDGRRHAICGAHGSHHPGQPADTLCGRQVVTRTASEREWILWTTCDECWHIAKSAQHASISR